jgi:hypothetical protein
MTTSLRKKLCAALTLPVIALVLVAGLPATAQATPDHYSPPSGPTFNDPYAGSDAAHKIVHKLVRTINSVRTGHKIRIASWNVRSNAIANALIAAHHRGVSVRVIMDYSNWNPDNPNNYAKRLHDALARGDKHRDSDMTSWLRRCHGSCRGPHGIAHTKFYLFDKVQKKKDVVMYGSANATELAATIQWNDLYTIKGSHERYMEFAKVFNQMSRDKSVKQGYLSYPRGDTDISFYPYRGDGTSKDPVLKVLNAIRCDGANKGTGVNGHTSIRIAQTATYGNRGLTLAKRLATMKKRGCNIRLVYAMFGTNVLKILRAAKVPLTHLAYDSDCNGIYDRYVHMKSMTVSGVYAGNRHARITWNGSANWTGVSLQSDEAVGMIDNGKITRLYSSWIDHMFTHVPRAWKPNHCKTAGIVTDRSTASTSVIARARLLKVDPYALIRKDL